MGRQPGPVRLGEAQPVEGDAAWQRIGEVADEVARAGFDELVDDPGGVRAIIRDESTTAAAVMSVVDSSSPEVDEFIEAGSCDFVRDLTNPLPAAVTLDWLGFPRRTGPGWPAPSTTSSPRWPAASGRCAAPPAWRSWISASGN